MKRIFFSTSMAILFLKIFYTLAFLISVLSTLVQHIPVKTFHPGSILQTVIIVFILFGLFGRKFWVVPLVGIVSVIGVINLLFFNSSKLDQSIGILVGLTLSLVSLYSITRTDVRKYFGAK